MKHKYNLSSFTHKRVISLISNGIVKNIFFVLCFSILAIFNKQAKSQSITIVPDAPVHCYGASSGSILATTTLPDLGSGYFYDLNAANSWTVTTGEFSGLAANITYTVCVTNGGLTSADTLCGTIVLSQPDPLVINFISDPAADCAGMNGGITAIITGGDLGPMPGYSTVWTNSGGTVLNPLNQPGGNYDLSVSGLSAGTYTLHIEDFLACTLDKTFQLNSICVNIDQAISCNGANDGSIQVNTSMTGTLYYQLDNAGPWLDNGGFFGGLTPGLHFACVTNGIDTICGDTTLIEPAPLTAVITTDHLAGCSANNGQLSVSINGGTIGPLPGYATEWRNSSSVLMNPFPNNYATTIGSLSAGNYTLHIEDYHYCTLDVSGTLGSLCLFVDQNISCKDSSDGTIQASTSSPGSWMYGIDGGAMNNPSGLFLGLDSGLHTICATNGSVTYCDTVSITEPDYLTASFIVDSLVSCHGNDGQLSINITGGTRDLQDALTVWTNSSNVILNDQLTNNTATTVGSLPTGNYFVRIEDDHACVITIDTNLGLTPTLSVVTTQTNASCYGSTNGSATANPSGGTPTYTYAWSNGQTTQTASGLAAGSYTVVVTDSRLCTTSAVVTITSPDQIIISLQSDSLPGCNPTDFGGLTAIISGGTSPYNTTWVNASNTVLNGPLPSTVTSIGGLVSGTYSLTVTDANGCNAVQSYYMPSLCLFVDQNVSCKDSADGTVQASTNLTGSIMYGIDGGPLNNPSGLFLGLDSGLHTICASNDGGITTYCDNVSISEPDYLTASFVIDSLVSCHDNDGQISILISGGTRDLQDALTVWTNSSNVILNDQLTNNTATTVGGLPAGNYFVRIEDDHACVINVDTTLTTSPAITVTGSWSPITCFGGTTLVSASSTGGEASPAHTYKIGTTSLPANFSAGTYTIVATDSRGCTGTTQITIAQPALITSSFSVTDCDSYLWETPTSIQTYTVSGAYVATYTALSGCDSVVTLNLTINYSSSSITNAFAGNSYFWNADGATYTASGTYYHTIPNGNAVGCDSNLTLNLSIIPLTLFVDQNVSCKDSADGTVQASTSAPGIWMFGIDGGPMTNPSGLFLDLDSGLHTICAFDGVNSYCDTVSISEPDYLVASFTIDSLVSCHGNDGQISILIDGGTRDLQDALTVWTNSSNVILNDQLTNNTATTVGGLPVGNYFVRVEDDHGCVIHVDTTLTASPAINVNASSTSISCYGATSTVSATSTGGDLNAPHVYTIGATVLPANFVAGTYTVVATDARGCTGTTSITITQPTQITYSFNQTACNSFTWTSGNGNTYTVGGAYTYTTTAANSCDSVVTLNLTVNYSTTSSTTVHAANAYTWAANGVTYTTSGTYTYTIANGNSVGCDSIPTLNLDLIPLTLFVDQNVSCKDSADGTVQASTSVPGTWMFGVDGGPLTNPSGLFLDLDSGLHTICANNGINTYCDTVSISEPDYLVASFIVDSTVSCLGNDGQLSIVISGGTRDLQDALTVWTNSSNVILNDQLTNNTATTISGLPTGNYFVRIEDDHACVTNIDTTLGLTPALIVTASSTPIICFGGSTTISATSTLGYQPATFAIGATPLPASFPAGTYTVTGTDTKGCTATTVITVTQPAYLPIVQIDSTCGPYVWAVNNQTYTTSGTYTASFTSVNGCDSSYQLILSFRSPTSSVQNIVAANSYTWAANGNTYTASGTYTHTLVGGNSLGCDSNLTLHLSIISIEAMTDQDISCFGAHDGSAVSSAAGASGNFVYDIDGANVYTNTTGTFLGLAPGIHTICAKELPSNVLVCDTLLISEPDPLEAYFVIDSTVSCLGNDGQISLVINGGTAVLQPYLTVWTNSTPDTLNDQNTDPNATTISNLPIGNYYVRVEDDHACVINVDTTLGFTAPVTVTASSTSIICNGGTSIITAVSSGGTGALSTTISGGTYTVSAGTYTITATDTKGCTGTTVITITQPALITMSENQTACNSYTWSVNSTAYTTSGTYVASFTNMNGCDSIHILNLTINYSSSSIENVTAANSYTWLANGTTYTASGTYTTTLFNGNSVACDSNLTLNLNILNINVIVDQDVSCNGNNDGSAQATASGGTGNFVYDLDGANIFTNTSGFFLGLTPGTHTICAKELPSNTVVCGTVLISQPAALSVVLTVDSTVSCLGNDGRITASITGGTAILQPYLTTWASGVTTNSLYDLSVGGLTPGTYTVTVEDDHLCFANASITVGLTPSVIVTASATPILCNGANSVISYSATGGTGVISTTITGGSFTVSAGTYTITATDVKGCTGTTVVTITQPALLAYSETHVACDSYTWLVNNTTYTNSGTYIASYTSINGCDSTYTLNLTVNYSSNSVENVTVANTYTWLANGITYTNSGTYYHTLTNAAGCDSNLTLNLNILNINVFVDQHVSCNGNNDGSAQAIATGGTGNYTYDLDGSNLYSNTTGFFIGLSPGSHTICAKESPSNAIICGTVVITQPAPLVVTLTVDSTVTCLGNDGGITATISGGTSVLQPYLTTWSSGVNTNTLYDLSVTGLTAGTYTVTVEDDHLCFATASITVGSTPAVQVSATSTAIACHGGTSVITPSTSGGTGLITTSISGGTYTVTAGTYTITGTDAKGCTGTTVISITEPAPLNVVLTVDSTVSCLGNDGGISALITGGTAVLQPYTTSWISGVVTNTIHDISVTGLSVGTYTVNVSDDNNCSTSASITVGLTAPIMVTATNTPITCFGGVSLVIPSANGGTGTLTTTINGGSFIKPAGTYTVTATDTKGCTGTTVISITQPALITSTEVVSAASSYTWSANNVTYTTSGIYTATLTSVDGCDSVATLNLTIAGVRISPKLFLAGPYVAADGMMHDSLRVQGLIPNTEPYTVIPYNKPTILDFNPAEKFVSNAILADTGANAIVDWVFVELRSGTTPSTIVATKRALLQRDGDVVSSVDGTSPLFFSFNAPGNYYVSVKHRNHLGVMTATALPLTSVTTPVDFTTLAPVYNHVASPPISNPARKTLGSVSLLWAGDANTNKNVKYNGLTNDKQEILNTVGVATSNNTVAGYRREDVNMDGIVRYNNADNDKNYILNNTIGINTPNAIVSQHTPN